MQKVFFNLNHTSSSYTCEFLCKQESDNRNEQVSETLMKLIIA